MPLNRDSIEYLAQIVADMRKAQVAYNNDWSASALARAVLAEQRVDDWIRKHSPEENNAERKPINT